MNSDYINNIRQAINAFQNNQDHHQLVAVINPRQPHIEAEQQYVQSHLEQFSLCFDVLCSLSQFVENQDGQVCWDDMENEEKLDFLQICFDAHQFSEEMFDFVSTFFDQYNFDYFDISDHFDADDDVWQWIERIQDHSELELRSIHDAGQHRADGGFGGFTCNSDCQKFFDKHEDEIWEKLEQQYDEFYGDFQEPESSQEAFADARQVKGNKTIPRHLLKMMLCWGRSDMLQDEDGYKTLLSWFILEDTGRTLDYILEV